jgi:hypothetical protein
MAAAGADAGLAKELPVLPEAVGTSNEADCERVLFVPERGGPQVRFLIIGDGGRQGDDARPIWRRIAGEGHAADVRWAVCVGREAARAMGVEGWGERGAEKGGVLDSAAVSTGRTRCVVGADGRVATATEARVMLNGSVPGGRRKRR